MHRQKMHVVISTTEFLEPHPSSKLDDSTIDPVAATRAAGNMLWDHKIFDLAMGELRDSQLQLEHKPTGKSRGAK
jgi:hypothetical protein